MPYTGTLFFPALLMIDNQILTDQGRSPVSVSRVEKSVVHDLADGSTHKYFKAVKWDFSTDWTMLSDDDEQNIDGGAGRKTLYNLVGTSERTHLLRFYDANGEWREHTVWVGDYSEEIVRRDPNTGLFFWEISLSLTER